MRHRVLLSTMAASFVLAGTAAAQGMSEWQKTHFGIVAGGTFSKLGGKDATEDGPVKTRVGMAGGVFATIGIAKNVALEPQVVFAMKGAKKTLTSENETINLKLNYVDIPLFLKFRFPSANSSVSPHIYLGPQLGLKVSCKYSAKGTTTISGNCDDTNLEFKTKGTDFNLAFGGGVDVGRALIDVRYDWGVSKIESPTTGDARNIKNRTFYILVGWTFKPAK